MPHLSLVEVGRGVPATGAERSDSSFDARASAAPITKSVEKEQSGPQSSSAHDRQKIGYSQSIPSVQSVNTCRWLIIAANLTTILIGTCYQWVIHCYLRIYRNSWNASTPALIFSFFFLLRLKKNSYFLAQNTIILLKPHQYYPALWDKLSEQFNNDCLKSINRSTNPRNHNK